MITNTFILVSGQLLVKALSVIWTFYLARKLGVDLFGRWAHVMALGAIFSVFRDFGTSTLLIREVSRHRDDFKRYFSNSFVLYTLLSSFVLLAMFFFAISISYPSEKTYLIALMGLSFVAFAPALSAQSILYGLEDFLSYMKLYCLGTCIYILIGILLVESGFEIRGAMIALCTGNILTSILLSRKMILKGGLPSLKMDFSLWKMLLQGGFLLTVGSLFAEISARADRLIIERFWDESAVGLYHSAFILAYLPRETFLVPLVGAFYPRLSSHYVSDPENFKWVFGKMNFLALLISLPVMFIIFFTSPSVIRFLYGESYLSAAPALSILVCSVPLMFMSGIWNQIFLVQRKENTYMWTTVFQMAATLSLNFFLVPRIGFIGSAYSFLGTQILNLLLVWTLLRKDCALIPWNRFFRLLLSGTLAAAVCYWLKDKSVWISLPFGTAAYGTGVLLFKAVEPDELHWIKGRLTKIIS